MPLRVHTWKGKVVRVELEPQASVLDVKQQLQILEGVPTQQQHLFLDGTELLDSDLVRGDEDLTLEIQASHSALLSMAVPQLGEVTLGEFNASLVQLGPRREAYQDRLDQWLHNDLQIYEAVLIPPSAPRSMKKDIELKRGPVSLAEYVQNVKTQISGLFSLKNIFGQGEQQAEESGGGGSFAWHPFLPKWALAGADDTVWLHDLRKGHWEEPGLVHKQQTGIRQIQWNPLSGSMLAVACESGICLWHSTGRPIPQSQLLRQSKNVTVLSGAGGAPVRTLSWSSCGRFLAATSKGSSQLVVWDVAKGILGDQTGLTVLGPPGASLRQCLWAPRSRHLLVTSTGSFRIWCRWKGDSEVGEHWTSTVHQTRSPVVAAVWNATGDVLLVAQKNSPLIHVVQCPSTWLEGSDSLDVSEVRSAEVTVGGPVHLLAWSPNSSRLAVSFTSTGSGGDLIALFDTSFQHLVLSFRPIGFIRGPPHPTPDSLNKALHMEFAPNFDNGALLSVLWSGGQISTHPLYFATAKRSKRTRATIEDDEPKRG